MTELSLTHPSGVMKYCPSCGKPGFSFDGEKLFRCGSCGFNYYINPAPAVAVIIESQDGRIAVTRRNNEPKKGFLDLPGGFVDLMESAEGAAHREVMEELGISVTDLCFLCTVPNEYVFKGLSYFTCDIGFSCRSEDLHLMKPADDVSEAFLVRPGDIDRNEIGFRSIERIIGFYLESKKK